MALHNAANDLLTATGVMTYAAGGSDFEWYHDQVRKHDFMASATLFKSDLPVEGILAAVGPGRYDVEAFGPDLYLPEIAFVDVERVVA